MRPRDKKKLEKLSPISQTISLTKRNRKLKKYEYSFDVRTHLKEMLGVDIMAIPGINASTALKIISEIGTDITKWPSAKHFCAWLGLCPGTRISGGRILRSKTKACTNKAALVLRMSANSLYRSNTLYGAFLRKMKSRKAPAQAVTALAHKMARTLYSMMLNKHEYEELGAEHYDKVSAEKTLKYLKKRAASLGCRLVEQGEEKMSEL